MISLLILSFIGVFCIGFYLGSVYTAHTRSKATKNFANELDKLLIDHKARIQKLQDSDMETFNSIKRELQKELEYHKLITTTQITASTKKFN